MTKLCPRGKAAAKRKFKVYPSAYANAYASKICAGKIKDPSGVKRKDFRGPKPMAQGDMVKVKKYNSGAITQSSPEQLGPQPKYTVTPEVRKSEEITDQQNISRQGFGLSFGTPVGKFSGNIDYTKTKILNPGFEIDQKRKSLSYDNTKRLGPGDLSVRGELSKTSSKSSNENYPVPSGKGYSAMMNYTIPLGGRKKGGVIKKQKIGHTKGGFIEGNYQDFVNELIK